MKIVSCSYNVTRPGDGKTMCAGILQSDRHRIGVAIKKQRSHGVNGIQSHASGSTGSENAVGQLFPKACVRSFTPNFFKLTEPLPNFFTSCSVSGHHSFNCDGFLITLHCSLSTARFYERAGNIVNDMVMRVCHRCLDLCRGGPPWPPHFARKTNGGVATEGHPYKDPTMNQINLPQPRQTQL